jgi:hypothetical protein
MTIRPLCFLAVAVLLSTTPARAADASAAQQAFDQAQKLMEAGNYAEACAKFEQSMRIEAGMATQFRLAECYDKDGRIASAWRNYQAVATAARADEMPDREKFALDKANGLLPRVSYVTIQVPAETAELPGLAVTVDGVVVPSASWGRVPADVGNHALRAAADGKQPWTTDVDVRDEGVSITVQIPPLSDEAPKEAGPVDVRIVDDTRNDGPAQPVQPAQLIAGIVIGGVGVAAMGAGIGIGFAAKAKHEESAPFCNLDLCTQEGLDIRSDARGLGTVGTVLFIGGAAAAAGGVVLVVTSPTLQDEGGGEVAFGVHPQVGGTVMTFGGTW